MTSIRGSALPISCCCDPAFPVYLQAHASSQAQPLSPRKEVDDVKGLLRQFPAEQMESFPVNTLVNYPRNEQPECVVPMAGG